MQDEDMQDEFRLIPIADLVDPPFVLRPVNRRGAEYVELRDSLVSRGFLNSICVRPSKRHDGKMEIVDGRWRTAASREACIGMIPCIVKFGLADKDVLAMQVTANAARPVTKPSEYARQIRRLLKSQHGMTQAELCQVLNKNPAWVRRMIGLASLSRYKVYRKAMDRGEMSLEAAYFLSKLPKDRWSEYTTEATVLPLREFKALIMAMVRQRRVAINNGTLRMKLTPELQPVPYARSLTDLQEECEARRVGPLAVAAADCKTPLDGWFAALTWAIHLDDESVKRQRARIAQRLKKRIIQRVIGEAAPDS